MSVGMFQEGFHKVVLCFLLKLVDLKIILVRKFERERRHDSSANLWYWGFEMGLNIVQCLHLTHHFLSMFGASIQNYSLSSKELGYLEDRYKYNRPCTRIRVSF